MATVDHALLDFARRLDALAARPNQDAMRAVHLRRAADLLWIAGGFAVGTVAQRNFARRALRRLQWGVLLGV